MDINARIITEGVRWITDEEGNRYISVDDLRQCLLPIEYSIEGDLARQINAALEVIQRL